MYNHFNLPQNQHKFIIVGGGGMRFDKQNENICAGRAHTSLCVAPPLHLNIFIYY